MVHHQELRRSRETFPTRLLQTSQGKFRRDHHALCLVPRLLRPIALLPPRAHRSCNQESQIFNRLVRPRIPTAATLGNDSRAAAANTGNDRWIEESDDAPHDGLQYPEREDGWRWEGKEE